MSATSHHVHELDPQHAAPIVVGIAATAESRAALDWAVDEARLRGRPLLLVHAVGDELATWLALEDDDASGLLQGVIDGAGRLLAQARDRVHDRAPTVPVRTQVSSVARDVALRGEAAAADLLVVGNHDAGGHATGGLDVLAPYLSPGLTCPVVAVPRSGPGGGVLVLADGGPASVATLAYAYELAALRGLRLRAVLCLPDPSATACGAELHLMDTVERLEEAAGPSLLGFERRVLHDRVRDLRRRFPHVAVEVIDQSGPVDDVLLRAARERDLIVSDAGHARRVLDMVEGVTSATLAAVTVLLPAAPGVQVSLAASAPARAVPLPEPELPEVHPAPELIPVRVRRNRADERGPWRHLHRYADDPDVA